MSLRVVLISTYDLGRQPFGLASPAAWLRAEGADVALLDLAVDEIDPVAVDQADLVAFHVPMHTATRLTQRVVPEVKKLNPRAHICVFGLYAPMNAEHLRSIGADSIVGGEFEQELVEVLRHVAAGRREPRPTRVPLDRLAFVTPDRTGLPPLTRYGHLVLPSGETRVSGYTEASRGCKHRCRHCPLVPIYNGRFRVVGADVVIEDIRQQVAAGAQHITFGDPDFFNGPVHALKIAERLHEIWPDLTYDVTIKIEHLRRHRDLLPRLKATGCALVTSAVESFDDAVLAELDKGHTRADIEAVVAHLREIDLAFNPTFVSFLPWTTVDGYCEMLETIARLDLVEHVSPVQYGIRLLLPTGSLLLDRADVAALVGEFDPEGLYYPWQHPDPAVDRLHETVLKIVSTGQAVGWSRAEIATEIWRAAQRARGEDERPQRPSPFKATTGSAPGPTLSESWYCCAEPTDEQLAMLTPSAPACSDEAQPLRIP